MGNYTNHDLAALITEIDDDAKGIFFNRFCDYCGKFLFPEETACKKCGTTATTPVYRAIPFKTSATAIAKLITWLKSRRHVDGYAAILLKTSDLISAWVNSDMSETDFNQAFINLIFGELSAIHNPGFQS